MSNLVDTTFFVGDISIPNTSKPEIAENLELFISRYEKELLQQLLGYKLWKLYDEDPSSQRFVDLIEGIEYNDGESNWRGLVYNISDSTHGSLIAYYVYFWWIKDQQIWNSGVGTLRPNPDKAEVMPIALKATNSWNTFSDQVREFVHYMQASNDIYPEWNNCYFLDFQKINDFDI